MVLPSALSYPTIENPVVLRPVAILPAAGAWDPAPVAFQVGGLQYVSFYITYLPGAALLSAVDIRFEVSPYSVDQVLPAGVQNWFPESVIRPGVVAPGVDTQNFIQRSYTSYTAQGAAVETFLISTVHLAGSAERLRVRARESGVIATPGTLTVIGLVFNEP